MDSEANATIEPRLGASSPSREVKESVRFPFAPKFPVVLTMRDAVPRHGSQ